MTILVDMDDTIEQLLAALVRKANERFCRSVTVDEITDWTIVCAYPGLEKQQILELMYEPGFWDTVEPVPGAADALKYLMDEGHQVYIVTATEFENVPAKMERVLFRYFPFLSRDQVIITGNKQMIRGDVLIDDGIHNLEGGEYRKILFDAGHNRLFDEKTVGAVRVRGWDEAYREVCRIARETENR